MGLVPLVHVVLLGKNIEKLVEELLCILLVRIIEFSFSKVLPDVF